MFITDATSLQRLMFCNGSRLLLADPVTTEQNTTIRDEGNAAHWLASVVFSAPETIDQYLGQTAPNGVFITETMIEHVREYVKLCGSGNVEWSYELNGQTWQINGRADFITFDGTVLRVPDFKYGYTIVSPEKNWPLIAHAIGYCATFNVRPVEIVFEIHQPRAAHHLGRVRTHSVTFEELCSHWQMLDATLSNLSDVVQTGKHCYKCPSFMSCPARQNAEMNAVDVAHNAYNANIDNNDISERYDLVLRAIELLQQSKKVYEEQLLTRLKSGQNVKNYSLIDDFSNTTWKNGVTVELLSALTCRDVAVQSLPTVTSARKLLGEEIVNAFTERKYKGVKLVRMDENAKAEKLFGKKG